MRWHTTGMLPLILACTDPVPTDSAPADTTTDSGDTDSADSGGEGSTDVTASSIGWETGEIIGAVITVSWTQSAAGTSWVEFQIDGEEWRSSPQTAHGEGAAEALLLGIPYDTAFTFRVVTGDAVSEEVSGQTAALPKGVPVPELKIADAAAWESTGTWLLAGVSTGSDGWDAEGFWKIILDRQGRPVWAHETPNDYRTFYMQPSYDGTEILWDENTFWTDFDLGASSKVHRMKIDGSTVETIDMPGLHHTFISMPDGVIAWGGVSDGREVLRERAADGTVTEIWDCSAYWEANNASAGCDGNAMYFNEDDNTYYFSSDVDHSVVEIDRATGEVLHLWGQLDGAWPFEKGSDPFFKQHSPTRTPEGNLLVSTWATQFHHELHAREFEIDEENQVLRQVWSCGAGTGDEARYAGEAHRLPGGNTLLNYGAGSMIREYTPDCSVAWHLAWTNNNLIGRAVFLEDLYAFAP